MRGALVIRWGAGVPGREAKGLEVFGKAVERFEQLAKDGRIDTHREFFAVSGRDGGFMIADGEVAELLAILSEEDSLRLNVQAAAIVQDFETQVYGGGTDAATQQMVGVYASGMQEVGYL